MDRKDIKLMLVTASATTILLLVLGVGGYFAYTKIFSSWIIKHNIKKESTDILKEVGKVVLLPEDEEPQVAKILDANQLKESDLFFASAQNGDAALFYKHNGLIVLYSMQNHKLLNMGALATSSSASQGSAPASSFNFNK